MFLLLTFPLADQIKAHVIIWKLVSLGFTYSSFFLALNGLILHSQNTKYLHYKF